MSHLRAAVACLVIGCASPEPPPADPGPGVDRVIATLDEAVRLDKERRDPEAVAAWSRALATFEVSVEPWLRVHVPHRERVRLEHGFSLIRSEIDQAKGRPGVPARELTERLRAAVDPGGQSAS